MRPNLTQLILLSAALSQQSFSYEAHEWGTFTSLLGSNGLTQNGMYHEDEVLPRFVHGFGETTADIQTPTNNNPDPINRPCHGKGCFFDEFYQNNQITQKMETPVVYFYSDKEESIDVKVDFPEGFITETFPAPVSVFPKNRNTSQLANGQAVFKVTTKPQPKVLPPLVDNSNIYSHARNVASTSIESHGENEKFIFYRGLGRFQPRIAITSKEGGLEIKGEIANLPKAAFLIDVDQNGDTRGMDLGDLSLKKVNRVNGKNLSYLQSHDAETGGSVQSGASIKLAMTSALERAGLKNDEAVAMLNTWEHGYLKTPGLRLLYILPRAEVDQILPISMSPAPEKLERVFVARMEILLENVENKIVQDVVTSNGQFNVNNLGRFAEPMLRRAKEVYRSQNVANQNNFELNALFDSLIKRASLNDTSASATAQ